MDKDRIIDILEEIALLLELKGENPFKSRAYANAARALAALPDDPADLVREGRLGSIKGIGDALQDKIATLVLTGALPYYDDLKASVPPGLLDMLDLPGLGPKKIKLLHEKLGIESVDALEAACQDGRAAALPGLGEKTAANILDSITRRRAHAGRFLFSEALLVAEDILDILRSHPATLRVSLAGSIRRGMETVKDIDLIASSKQPAELMDAFVHLPGVQKISAHGETKSSVVLEGGIACDLRVVPDDQFASALLHFTGSKEHNIALRQRALARGLTLSEWGLAAVESGKQKSKIENRKFPTESSLYDALDLAEIPPEMRENLGEIEDAENGRLPRLVEWTQLRGCFHNHTNASDGRSTLEQMLGAACSIGMDYLGIADHSKSSVQANGLSAERLLDQVEAIHQLNRDGGHPCHLFAGVECDILKDGSLDYPDEILARLDYVVASVHNSTTLDEKSMTRRYLRAMENPYVTMIGHPTGRLLLQRDPCALDIQTFMKAAAATGTWVELNASPMRMDLDWRHWRAAREHGVRCVINPDAHHTAQLGNLRLGILAARKAGLSAKDIINTLPLADIRTALARKRPQLP